MYILTIKLAIDDVSMCYSQQLAILLFLLKYGPTKRKYLWIPPILAQLDGP
jgi:hypothetical protein